MTSSTTRRDDARTTIVDAAAQLLREGGPAAVTTRSVASAAGVQPPTIYRHFGDKDGLMDAVAEHVMASFVSAKAASVETAAATDVDPLDDLRSSWNAQIDFGLANPSIFRLLSDPDRVVASVAARTGKQVLEARVARLARTGRLRVGEQRAAEMIQASGIGTIQALLATPAELRDTGLADAMFDAVLTQILTDAPALSEPGPLSTTVAFRAVAPDLGVLSEPEQQLLEAWLDRIVDDLEARHLH